MNKPILLLDFDGVINSYTSGWDGADSIPDDPVPGAFAFIYRAQERFDVQVYSSRSHQEGGIEAMSKWFLSHRMRMGNFNMLKFPTTKPPAFLTIDDRGWQFTGEFPSVEELLAFKPWYAKDLPEIGLPAGVFDVSEAIEEAWGLIANARAYVEDHPDFNDEHSNRPIWVKAAERWRDKYM